MSKRSNKFGSFKVTTGSSYFGLGRVFDLNDKLNRKAILCTLVLAVAVMIYETIQGMSTTDVTTYGFVAGCNFFFSNLIAQEFDPEPRRREAGLLAGLFAVVAQLFIGVGDVSVLLWALFVLRMFNRSAGDRHKIGDNLIILATTFWLGKEGLWLFPVLTAALYVIESQIKEGYFRSLYLAGISFAMYLVIDRTTETPQLSLQYVILLCITFFIFAPELIVASQCTAKGDKNNQHLIPQRIQMGQGLVFFATIMLSFFSGDTAVRFVYPVWMSALGCGVYLLLDILKNKKAAPETETKIETETETNKGE
jgi:hypothetical protein